MLLPRGGGSVRMSERDHFSKQIDLLVSSSALHGSESLCKLLRYLAKHAMDQPGAPLKEYQIATEVYGRRPDFDPQLDSTIRVQAGRLRGKLAEYYGAEGANDPIVVDLPKGTYVLQFHRRTLGDVTPSSAGSNGRPKQEAKATGTSPTGKVAIITLCVLLAISLAGTAWLLTSSKSVATQLRTEIEPVPGEFRQFWKPFLAGPEEPWLIFSNAAFVGRPETGMRYYNSAQDSNRQIWDHYTGVGEVLAVHELDQVFASMHRQMRVKRGSLFSLDDVKNNDLIFLGSPSENLTLMEIPSTREFVFQRVGDGPRKGDLAIVNVHPQDGEQRVLLASPSVIADDRRLRCYRIDAWSGSGALGHDPGRHHNFRHASRRRVHLPSRFIETIAVAASGFKDRRPEAVRSATPSQGRAWRARGN